MDFGFNSVYQWIKLTSMYQVTCYIPVKLLELNTERINSKNHMLRIVWIIQ